MGRMSSFSRLAPLALLAATACTVFVVPDDTEGGGSTGGGGSTSTANPTTGEPTTGPDGTTAGTSTTSTTSSDPSGDPSSPSDPSGEPATTTPETTGEPPPADCDFPTAIQPIFSDRCGCHNGGMPPKGLVLSAGNAFDNLVGVDSLEQPGTPRVDPGNAAGSWLVTKLKPAPPVGSQMPEGGMLDADQVALIEAWIDAGAPEAGAFSCGGGGGGAGSVTIDPQGPVEVDIGETLDLDVLVLDGNGDPVPMPTVKWKSSDEKTLYVDGKGLLLGVLPGDVQVTAEVDGVVSPPLSVTVTLNDPPAATFAEVLAILTTRCGCHSGAMPPAMMAFDTGADAVHTTLLSPSIQQPQLQRVAGDNPAQSYLFQKLTWTTPPTGAQMPKGNAPLEADKVQVILRWIIAGAPK